MPVACYVIFDLFQIFINVRKTCSSFTEATLRKYLTSRGILTSPGSSALSQKIT